MIEKSPRGGCALIGSPAHTRHANPIIAQRADGGTMSARAARVRFSDRVEKFGDSQPHISQAVRVGLTPGNA